METKSALWDRFCSSGDPEVYLQYKQAVEAPYLSRPEEGRPHVSQNPGDGAAGGGLPGRG